MKITETVTRDVVTVEVTDECMVGIVTATRDTSLFPASARELASFLVRAADEAERASAEVLHPVVPAKFDTAVIAPDCRDGKHLACVGDAWSVAEDAPAPCDCPCHAPVVEEQAA